MRIMTYRSVVTTIFLQTCVCCLLLHKSEGWISSGGRTSRWAAVLSPQRLPQELSAAAPRKRKRQPIVDAEFERVTSKVMDESAPEEATDKSTRKRVGSYETLFESKSLIELSLEADAKFNNTRVPFLDTDGERYIDAKLAFMVECDGVQYGIGVPFDHSAAISVENKDGSVTYVSPDDGSNEEVMQIFAAQLQTEVGENLQLKRTPRVLTIAGPLEELTRDWRETIKPNPVGINELLDESDEDVESFLAFMRKELGEETVRNVMEDETNDIPDEIKKLFDIPGFGDQEDDIEGMNELMRSIMDPPEMQVGPLDSIGEDLGHDGVALKLVSYVFPGGKIYSLVSLLKPYVLIARFVQVDGEGQFLLLSQEEEKTVGPRIEALCQDDLEKLSKE